MCGRNDMNVSTNQAKKTWLREQQLQAEARDEVSPVAKCSNIALAFLLRDGVTDS